MSLNNNKNSQEEKIESKDVKPKEIDIKRYKDLSGVTIQKLNWGLWYVEHRQLLQKIFFGFLIIIGIISWAYTIYGFAYYFLRGMSEDELITKEIAEQGFLSHDAILQTSPNDLVLDAPKVLKADGKKYDFLIRIKNPSENHVAEFEYYFLASGQATRREQGFILPDETKYLVVLGEEFNFNPVDIQFRLESILWRRIDKHKIPDWQKYKDERLNITTSDSKFIPAKASGLSEKLSLNQAEFKAKNNSPFNYWNVNFIIVLWGGVNIAGINGYSLEEFMAGQEREISLTWPGVLNYVTRIEIIPEVNLLRSDIYIKPKGRGDEK